MEVLDKIRRDIEEIIVDCNEVTDRNITLIEERLGVVRSVAEQMDKKLIALTTACDDAELIIKEFKSLDISSVVSVVNAIKSVDAAPEDKNVDKNETVVDFDGLVAKKEREHNMELPSALPLDDRGAISDGVADSRQEAVIDFSADKSDYDGSVSSLSSENIIMEKVLSLYREGYSLSYIARETGKTVGEVDFIISLEKTLFDKR
ncbi:hypothetical protein WKV44_08790 [Spirochaetia bacterium 38H-sp]|uniref:Helix-turn-helix domain-containing protein n=1 Tax=Rarispira pelagica TaxID=3141764 RepID=A0ABU9UD88_9SPIR